MVQAALWTLTRDSWPQLLTTSHYGDRSVYPWAGSAPTERRGWIGDAAGKGALNFAHTPGRRLVRGLYFWQLEPQRPKQLPL
jgi:hypothetical protein